MYTELSFLFETNRNIMSSTNGNGFSNNNTLWGENPNEEKNYTVYKDISIFEGKNGDIKNYIKQKIYDTDVDDMNPYVSLIKDTKYNNMSKKLKASHFTYLRDLGVYPINRLIVLRRYPEGVAVYDDLEKIGAEPISTVIGWLREDAEIFNISFNENWGTSNKYLHEIINDILNNEFKMGGMENIVPMPGFTQGLLFGFFEKLGLSEKGSMYDIPFGDPNLLREAATRDYQQQGLLSNMNISFETTYEQKFIGNYDPATAMLDILRNLTAMGTSNTRYLFKMEKGGILEDLLNATQGKGNNIALWSDVITKIITKFTEAVSETVAAIALNMTSQEKSKYDEEQAKKNAEQAKKNAEESKKTKVNKSDESKEVKETTKKSEAEEANDAANAFNNKLTSLLESEGVMGAMLKNVLASTFAKHRWPIRGSIGAMTGIPTAPWHITVGNPYSPIISAGNMIVDKIEVSSKGEMGFNDLPLQITAKISIKFGRNLGKQEIDSLFNNGYRRIYSKK